MRLMRRLALGDPARHPWEVHWMPAALDGDLVTAGATIGLERFCILRVSASMQSGSTNETKLGHLRVS